MSIHLQKSEYQPYPKLTSGLRLYTESILNLVIPGAFLANVSMRGKGLIAAWILKGSQKALDYPKGFFLGHQHWLSWQKLLNSWSVVLS